MKQTFRFLFVFLALSAILLSACGGTAVATNPAGSKVQAIPVQYTGVLESMNGTQWVVSGQTITVDPSVVRDGPFQVGDTIKLEVVVDPNGSITVSRVEAPGATDLSVLPQLGNDNSNNANNNGDNANNVNSNDINSNGGNSNVSNTNTDNSNSASGSETFGTVEAITATSITIDGQTFNFQAGTEVTGDIVVGAFVKLHLEQNADGTVTVLQVELSDPSQTGNDNSSNANTNGTDDNSSNSGNDNGGGGNNNGGGGGNGNGGGGGGGNDNGGGGNGNGGGG